MALNSTTHPVALALTRQKVRAIPSEKAKGLHRGGYILWENQAHPELILIASGSEVGLALTAAQELASSNIAVRVVSMPCWERFDEQDAAYRNQVLPPHTRRLAIEALSPLGWEKYVGEAGAVLGLDHFGASAPAEELFQHFGFTVERVTQMARELLSRQDHD